MTSITVYSSGHQVLGSGSVITYSNTSDISFIIEMDETFKFQLVLKFEDIAGKESKIDLAPDTQKNILTMTCINFNNSLGIGTTAPIEVATFRGKTIFLHLWVYTLGEKNLRKITYSLYLE